MRVYLLFVLFSGLYILTGCGSKVPISDVSLAVTDDRILGSWISDRVDNEQMKLNILQFNEKEYFIHVRSIKFSEAAVTCDTLCCRAYITMVGEKPFLNVQPIDTTHIEKRDYFFFAYRFTDDTTMTIRGLENVDSVSINDFQSSEELFSFIEKHIDKPDLYDDPIKFIRKTSRIHKQ